MTTQALVRVQDVEKTFHRGSEEIHVLAGLHLEVPTGEFLALMGPSGSGKSTLLNTLTGAAVLADALAVKGASGRPEDYQANPELRTKKAEQKVMASRWCSQTGGHVVLTDL